MTLFETLKFIHIAGATIVVGGGFMIFAFSLSALRGGKADRVRALGTLSSWVGPRVFAPAWALVLAFGIWAGLEGNFDFGDAWIGIGFVVFALSFIAGPTLHERHARALTQAIAEDGPTSSATLAIARRETIVQGVEAALLIFAVWAMTAKPGL